MVVASALGGLIDRVTVYLVDESTKVWFAIVARVDVQPRRDAVGEIGAHSEVLTHDRFEQKANR
jgi:hypothetical protein